VFLEWSSITFDSPAGTRIYDLLFSMLWAWGSFCIFNRVISRHTSCTESSLTHSDIWEYEAKYAEHRLTSEIESSEIKHAILRIIH
jgi:hypothetical protein